MSYIPDIVLTQAEQDIVSRVRSLIGDTKEVFIDDFPQISICDEISSDGTLYQFRETRAYPLEITISGVEITGSGNNPQVLSYKYLKFNSPGPLTLNTQFRVIYEKFRHSDKEILNVYDTGAFTYASQKCNLDVEAIPIDLLVLITAYILLQSDLNLYIGSAVSLRDADSQFDAQVRAEILRKHLEHVSDEIETYLKSLTSCVMMNLPVKKVE